MFSFDPGIRIPAHESPVFDQSTELRRGHGALPGGNGDKLLPVPTARIRKAIVHG